MKVFFSFFFRNSFHRHGNRNIIETYPKDPWKSEAHWPGGYGELSNSGRNESFEILHFYSDSIEAFLSHQIGKQQLYELGKYLRKRYAKLLRGGRYSANKVYVQSTVVQITSGKVQ